MRGESSPGSIGCAQRFLAAVIAVALAYPPSAQGQRLPPAPADGAPSSGALSPFSSRKAEVLLREQLPCLGCHVLKGEGGRIGPELTTVRDRRTPSYIAAIVTDPQATAPGSVMPKSAMPDATRKLIVRYLTSLPGRATAGQPIIPRAVITAPADGPALYGRWCAACHGNSGKGDGPNAEWLPVRPAAHADAAAMSKRPDDSLYDTIAGGGAIMNRSPRMPAFGATLAPTEIRALVAHIRTLCQCRGPEWSRDDASHERSRRTSGR